MLLCSLFLCFVSPFGVAIASLFCGEGAVGVRVCVWEWVGGGGGEELILVLFVRLFGFCLFVFVGFLFLLVSEKSCDL